MLFYLIEEFVMKKIIIVAVMIIILTFSVVSCGNVDNIKPSPGSGENVESMTPSVESSENIDDTSWERTPLDGSDFSHYRIQISASEDTVFVTDYTDQSGISSEETAENASPASVKLGNREVNVIPQKTVTRKNGNVERYYADEEGAFECRLLSLDHSFVISAKKGALASFDNNTQLSETTLIGFVEKSLEAYIDPAVLASHQLGLTTRVNVSSSDAAWAETKDGFFSPNPADEEGKTVEVRYYELTYSLYCGEYKTNDYVTVRCDAKGNITYLVVCFTGIDWSSVQLPVQGDLQTALVNKIRTSLNGSYQYVDARLSSQAVSYSKTDGIRLTFTYEVQISSGGDETYGSLCALTVTFGNALS